MTGGWSVCRTWYSSYLQLVVIVLLPGDSPDLTNILISLTRLVSRSYLSQHRTKPQLHQRQAARLCQWIVWWSETVWQFAWAPADHDPPVGGDHALHHAGGGGWYTPSTDQCSLSWFCVSCSLWQVGGGLVTNQSDVELITLLGFTQPGSATRSDLTDLVLLYVWSS